MRTRSRDYGDDVAPERSARRSRGSTSPAPALRRSKRLACKARVRYYVERTFNVRVSMSEAALAKMVHFGGVLSWIANSQVMSEDQYSLMREVVRALNERVVEQLCTLERHLDYSSGEKVKCLRKFLRAISDETFRELAKILSHGPMAHKPAFNEFHSRPQRHFAMQADEAAELEWRYVYPALPSDSD